LWDFFFLLAGNPHTWFFFWDSVCTTIFCTGGAPTTFAPVRPFFFSPPTSVIDASLFFSHLFPLRHGRSRLAGPTPMRSDLPFPPRSSNAGITFSRQGFHATLYFVEVAFCFRGPRPHITALLVPPPNGLPFIFFSAAFFSSPETI